jgi:hypothetical protein
MEYSSFFIRNPEKVEPVHQYQSISDDENEAFGPPLGTVHVPPVHRNIFFIRLFAVIFYIFVLALGLRF